MHFYLKSPVSLDFSVEKKKCLKITIVTQMEIPHLFSHHQEETEIIIKFLTLLIIMNNDC